MVRQGDLEGRNLPTVPDQSKLRVARFRSRILKWYAENARAFQWRMAGLPNYELVVAELLLQRSRAETIAAYYPAFLKRFAGWNALASADEEELATFLRPIGLWRRRSATFRELAREMVRRGGDFPRTRLELEELPAIGQYLANSILLLIFQRREPLLDSGMARLLRRYFGLVPRADIRSDRPLQRTARDVISRGDPKRVNWAMLDFAAAQCTLVAPKCESCPMVDDCHHASAVGGISGR